MRSSKHCIVIRSQVLNEFTHGKQEKISKTQFKEVLSDILLGMAAGLKRDPVVILRIDGEDLHEFVSSPTFEPEILSLFSEIDMPEASLKDYILKAFEKLSVDQGMPPATDPWVHDLRPITIIFLYYTDTFSLIATSTRLL